MLDPDDFAALAHGYALAWLCSHLDITPRTLRDYKAGKRPVPRPIMHLMRLMALGDLSALGGPEWQGFTLNRDGTLSLPLFPRPVPPRRIAAMFFLEPEQRARDLERAQRELAQARADLEAEKEKAAQYRRLLKESSTRYALGLHKHRF